VIVTLNVRHFPAEVLAPLGIEAVTPDQFLCNLLDLAPGAYSAGAAADPQPPGSNLREPLYGVSDRHRLNSNPRAATPPKHRAAEQDR